MTKIFGANWSTTVSGWITILAVAIAAKPELIAFLPDSWEPTVSGICGLIAVVSAGTFAYQAKSKNVTGGTVQQTTTGAVAPPAAQSRSSAISETIDATPIK